MREREVDHDVDGGIGGQRRAERDTQRRDRRECAGVRSEVGMTGPFQRRGQLERGIHSDELDQSCSHPTRSTVDADGQYRLGHAFIFLSIGD